MLKRRKSTLNENSKIIIEHGKNRDKLIWISANGHSRTLPEMDTNHIKNAIAKIQRGDLEERRHQLQDLITEKIYREVLSVSKQKNTNTKDEQREQTGLRRRRVTKGAGSIQ